MTTQSSIQNYEVTQDGGVPIKSWTKGVAFEDKAREQLINISKMPFIHKWVAVMPDVHLGIGATIGSVVPTIGAVIPAAVGVDIGSVCHRYNLHSYHRAPRWCALLRSNVGKCCECTIRLWFNAAMRLAHMSLGFRCV